MIAAGVTLYGTMSNLQIHQQFRGRSGNDSEENLITLCAICHTSVHGRIAYHFSCADRLCRIPPIPSGFQRPIINSAGPGMLPWRLGFNDVSVGWEFILRRVTTLVAQRLVHLTAYLGVRGALT